MPTHRILIIDYEPRSIQQLRAPLEAAGYDVHVAQDGLAGIEAFKRLKPHLTLIEAMLPKKHGFEVCQELKQTPHGKQTPILIVTSVYKGRKYRTQALHNYGCNEYLEKPIPAEKLVETVVGFLGAAPAETAAESPNVPAEPVATRPVAAAGPKATAPAAGSDDDVEIEILERLDQIMPGDSSGTPRASVAEVDSTEKVVSFDPERSRKRRNPNSGVVTSTPSVGGTSIGGAARSVANAASLDPHREPAVMTTAEIDPVTQIDPQTSPQIDPRPAARPTPAGSGPRWVWIAVGLALLALTAAAVIVFLPR